MKRIPKFLTAYDTLPTVSSEESKGLPELMLVDTGEKRNITFKDNSPFRAYFTGTDTYLPMAPWADTADTYAYSHDGSIYRVPKLGFEPSTDDLNAHLRHDRALNETTLRDFDKLMLAYLGLGTAPITLPAATSNVLMPMVMNPVSTALGIGGYELGSRGFDNVMQRYTGKNWSEYMKDKYNMPEWASGLINPVGMLTGGVGSLAGRMYELLGKTALKQGATALGREALATPVILTQEIPWNNPDGYYVTPQIRRVNFGADVAAGENGGKTGVIKVLPAEGSTKVSEALVIYNLSKGKYSRALLELLLGKSSTTNINFLLNRDKIGATMSGRVGKGDTTKFNGLVKKITAKLNGTSSKEANAMIRQGQSERLAETPEGRVAAIRNKYAKQIEESINESGIDWSDLSTVMASMPNDLKLSPVGFDTETPFLERYYNNVVEKVLGENGIQNRLLKSGELRRNERGQWEGLFADGTYKKVEPTEYIKMRMANEKGHNLSMEELPMNGTNYPMHGTLAKTYNHLTKPSSSPGEVIDPNGNTGNGIWTGILDELGMKSGMLEYYRGLGASVPFFRMPDYELPIMKSYGISSSNSYGGTGKSLMRLMGENPGKIQRPTEVSDPRGSGMPYNEYNFGPNVPNPKSMWNTLDFDFGAGPLAYNLYDLENNYA